MSIKKELLKTMGKQCKSVFITTTALAKEVYRDCKETGKRVINAIKDNK